MPRRGVRQKELKALGQRDLFTSYVSSVWDSIGADWAERISRSLNEPSGLWSGIPRTPPPPTPPVVATRPITRNAVLTGGRRGGGRTASRLAQAAARLSASSNNIGRFDRLIGMPSMEPPRILMHPSQVGAYRELVEADRRYTMHDWRDTPSLRYFVDPPASMVPAPGTAVQQIRLSDIPFITDPMAGYISFAVGERVYLTRRGDQLVVDVPDPVED